MHSLSLLLTFLGLVCAISADFLNTTLPSPGPIDIAPPLDTGGHAGYVVRMLRVHQLLTPPGSPSTTLTISVGLGNQIEGS